MEEYCYNSRQRQILHQFTNIRCELQQLMHTKCHKTGILALALTLCSKCVVRVWKITEYKHTFEKIPRNYLQSKKVVL